MIIRDGSVRNNKGRFVKGFSLYKGVKKNIKHNKQFKKGQVAWNKGKHTGNSWKGKKHTEATKEKIRLARLGKFIEENSPVWVGDKIGYHGVHAWINRHFGKATHCDFDRSHVSTRYHWANISGSYLRNIDDFVQLCPSCHFWYDRIRRGAVY